MGGERTGVAAPATVAGRHQRSHQPGRRPATPGHRGPSGSDPWEHIAGDIPGRPARPGATGPARTRHPPRKACSTKSTTRSYRSLQSDLGYLLKGAARHVLGPRLGGPRPDRDLLNMPTAHTSLKSPVLGPDLSRSLKGSDPFYTTRSLNTKRTEKRIHTCHVI